MKVHGRSQATAWIQRKTSLLPTPGTPLVSDGVLTDDGERFAADSLRRFDRAVTSFDRVDKMTLCEMVLAMCSTDSVHAPALVEMRKSTDVDAIAEFVRAAGASGVSGIQVCAGVGVGHSSVCARLSQLVRAGRLVTNATGKRGKQKGGIPVRWWSPEFAPAGVAPGVPTPV